MTAIAIPLAHAPVSTTVSVNPKNSYQFLNQSFSINVNITNVNKLNFWEVKLTFDSTVLNCTNAWVPPNNIFAGYSQVLPPSKIDNTAGTINIAAWLDSSKGVNGSGTLFQIEFKSKTEGTSSLNFTNKGQVFGTRLLDPASNPIPFEAIDGLVDVIGPTQLIVPFHFQDKTYYSGPASLEMVFDFYGEDIPQLEIAEVARTRPNITYTDELRRAGHFSNLSTSTGPEMPGSIIGYSLRKFGYGAFEKTGLILRKLQETVRNGYPIIVSTWYDLSKQKSQYRVVVGYNATHIILHDPWNKAAWGGTYGGSNTALDYTTFLDLWSQSNYWGLLVHPWTVTVTLKILDKQPYKFNVTANIQYTDTETFRNTTYSATSANAKIILPPQLSLDIGESITKTLGTGNIPPGSSAGVNWIVKCSTSGIFNVTIEAKGRIAGTVATHGSYPGYNYQDAIGGKGTLKIWLGFPGDITGDGKVDVKDLTRVAKAYGSYPGQPNWDPVSDVSGSTAGVPDGKVDVRDLAYIAKNYGKIY